MFLHKGVSTQKSRWNRVPDDWVPAAKSGALHAQKIVGHKGSRSLENASVRRVMTHVYMKLKSGY